MKKVLIIDDDMLARTTMALILERAGYHVVTAEDGRKGLSCMRKEEPDLVITDIIMPEKEGIETIQEILASRPQAKIIAVSGGGARNNMEFLRLAKILGASEVLAKPFEPEDLLVCVARCIEARNANRSWP
jgi:DNA-binding NtrC family response regulator